MPGITTAVPLDDAGPPELSLSSDRSTRDQRGLLAEALVVGPLATSMRGVCAATIDLIGSAIERGRSGRPAELLGGPTKLTFGRH